MIIFPPKDARDLANGAGRGLVEMKGTSFLCRLHDLAGYKVKRDGVGEVTLPTFPFHLESHLRAIVRQVDATHEIAARAVK